MLVVKVGVLERCFVVVVKDIRICLGLCWAAPARLVLAGVWRDNVFARRRIASVAGYRATWVSALNAE